MQARDARESPAERWEAARRRRAAAGDDWADLPLGVHARWFESEAPAGKPTPAQALEVAERAQREVFELKQQLGDESYRDPRMADYMLLIVGVVAGNFLNHLVPRQVGRELRESSFARGLAAFFLLFLTMLFNAKNVSIATMAGYAIVLYVWVSLVARLSLVQFAVIMVLLLVTVLVSRYRLHASFGASECHRRVEADTRFIENASVFAAGALTLAFGAQSALQ